LTPNQTWLHSLDFPALIKEHERYLHGNPYLPGKVVLDREIYDKNSQYLTHIKPASMKRKFESMLKDHCKDAEQNKEKVLIMMLGHGEKNTGHFLFPSENVDMDHWPLYDVKSFVKRLNLQKNVQVMFLSTACYSGKWLRHEDLNISGAVAADPGKISRSWRRGGSVGGHCGSMFATMIIRELTSNLDTTPLSGAEVEKQEKTYAEFTRVAYETLLSDIDRRGWTHQISFRAQDDKWDYNHQSRTGFPLQQLQHRWESLKTYPADRRLHPGDPMNRNPRVPQEQVDEYHRYREEWKRNGKPEPWKYQGPLEATGSLSGEKRILGKRSVSWMLRDSPASFHSFVKSQAKIYLASHPGDADRADNNGLDTLIWTVLKHDPNHGPYDEWLLHATLRQVTYRLTVMEMANRYIEALDIRGPNGQSCQEFHPDKFENSISGNKNWEKIYNWFLGEDGNGPDCILFPRLEMETDGQEYDKGSCYVMAAIYHSGLEKKQIEERMKELVSQIKSDCKSVKDLLKEVPAVKAKRRKLAEAHGQSLRDLSPIRASGNESRPSRAGSDPRGQSGSSSSGNPGPFTDFRPKTS
jgi:hypothetical protein